jgi:hypothetical protein
MTRPGRILAAAATAGAGAALAAAVGSAGVQPGGPTHPNPPPQTGTIYAPDRTPALELNPPQHIVQAGETALVRGHSWWPSLTCTSPVKLRIRDSAGDSHRLPGTVYPISGGGQFDPDFILKIKPVLADILGRVGIPEEVAPGRATVTADQDARIKLFFPPCVQIGTKRKTARVEVLPPRFDSRVITEVAAQPVPRGTPITLSFRLSRPGRVKVVFEFVFTAQRMLPLSTPLDAQRPAGVHQLQVDTTLAGHALPVGRYRLYIEHRDPAGSTQIPAAPKSIGVALR